MIYWPLVLHLGVLLSLIGFAMQFAYLHGSTREDHSMWVAWAFLAIVMMIAAEVLR